MIQTGESDGGVDIITPFSLSRRLEDMVEGGGDFPTGSPILWHIRETHPIAHRGGKSRNIHSFHRVSTMALISTAILKMKLSRLFWLSDGSIQSWWRSVEKGMHQEGPFMPERGNKLEESWKVWWKLSTSTNLLTAHQAESGEKDGIEPMRPRRKRKSRSEPRSTVPRLLGDFHCSRVTRLLL